ncbi:MAG: glycosyltransferase, partial [Candidatus Dormibacteria bacterium]
SGLAAEKAEIPWVSYVDYFLDETLTAGESQIEWWNALRARLGLSAETRPATEARWFAMSSHLTLVFGLPCLGLQGRRLPSYVREVGPITWDPPYRGDPPLWLDELGRHRPAILISTSSLWLGDADLVTITAEALAGESCDLVATLPAQQDLPQLPNDVMVSSYLPHSLLLPKVDLVVCSGGLGVTTKALLAGIPVVAVPRGLDGYSVTRAAVASGAALAVDHRTLRPGDLRDVLLHALSDEGLRTSALVLANAGKEYDSATTSADLIEGLLRRSLGIGAPRAAIPDV